MPGALQDTSRDGVIAGCQPIVALARTIPTPSPLGRRRGGKGGGHVPVPRAIACPFSRTVLGPSRLILTNKKRWRFACIRLASFFFMLDQI